MKDYYQGKCAVVTGAASGMGREMALQLAEAGANVMASDVNEAGLAETARLAEGKAGQVLTRLLNVADREAVLAHADDAIAALGQVDLVINNAGVTQFGLTWNVEFDDFDWLLGINLWGVIHGSKAFLPHMMERGSGQIVNMSSIFGFVGVRGQSAYNTSKFAVRGFTESLARELVGTGVTAHCVHPGGINTNIARDGHYRDGGELYGSKEEAVAQSEKILRMPPAKAARIILKGVAKNRRRIRVGADSVFFDVLARIAPVRYDSVLRLMGG